MRTFTGAITQDNAIDAFYLQDQLLLFPEIKKKFIKSQCESETFTALELVFGYGHAISDTDLKRQKMYIADYRIQWTILPRLNEYMHFAAVPTNGQGAGDTSFPIQLQENWASVGMVLKVDDGNGGWQVIVITSSDGASSGSPVHYNYHAKLVTGDEAATFNTTFMTTGYAVGWAYSLDAACGYGTTQTPIKFPDWYVNYTTILKQENQICKDGMQSGLWIEGGNGLFCYQPLEEMEKWFFFLSSMEYAAWYGQRTYNDDGVCIKTDANGNPLRAGDGILLQGDSSTLIDYDVSYYDQPGAPATGPHEGVTYYEQFRQLFNTEIVKWGIENDIYKDDYELHVYAGLAAYAFFQNVLTGFLDQSGGCCYMDYESGQNVSAGINIIRYKYAGYILNIHKNVTFSKKGVNAGFYLSTGIPIDAYRFVVMPQSNCSNEPLIQCYFRGGCGVESAYTHTVIPGTVNPIDPKSTLGASTLRGYVVVDESEFVFILSDPGKMMHWQGTTTMSS